MRGNSGKSAESTCIGKHRGGVIMLEPSMPNQRSSMHFLGERRDRLFILAAMLSYTGKGARATELMNKVGLCSAQMDMYIPVLIGANLLEVNGYSEKSKYQITDKGRKFLAKFTMLLTFFV
jgi:predicted transcriptional regulator